MIILHFIKTFDQSETQKKKKTKAKILYENIFCVAIFEYLRLFEYQLKFNKM